MIDAPVIDSVARLREQLAHLEGAWIVGLDLRDSNIDWSAAKVTGAALAGCRLDADDEDALRRRGVVLFPELDDFGFDPYRGALYTHDELMAGYEPGHPESTLDARIGARTQGPAPAFLETLARGIHDACIDAALLRYLQALDAPIVGVMGSHATPRTDPAYRDVARLARDLTRAGFVVATGGGPGLMEAANLGAWLASAPDDAVDAAVAILAACPGYDDDPPGFLEAALAVRTRWPDGAESLGVPTWLYVDEPLNQFATCLAKYFQNSIRENGLLAIALGGIVYTPGASGTAQEIFTDAAQNEYTMYGVRSPMVFLGAEHYERAHPGLVAAVLDLARTGGWEHLVRVVDTPDDACSAIRELAPTQPQTAHLPETAALPFRKR